MKLPRGKSGKRGYLDGQMLIAMPSMLDERFVRSLIYICLLQDELGCKGKEQDNRGPYGHRDAQVAGNAGDLAVRLDKFLHH